MASHYSNREQFNPLAETATDRHHPSPSAARGRKGCCMLPDPEHADEVARSRRRACSSHVGRASARSIGRDLNWIIESMLCVVGGGGLRST
jgi:hypothetical protein